ncbi:MAG: T9SS type A sorting domain-containing protein [bacterium]|nr:T9SS type A sorting domain-containing protein [bacterium]
MERRVVRLVLLNRIKLKKLLEGIKFPPMKWMILLVLILGSMALFSVIEIKQEIPFGSFEPNIYSPIIINRETDTLLSILCYTGDYNNAIYKWSKYQFEFLDFIKGGWIRGIGDFDSDGFLDLMGINPSDSNMIFIIEQLYKDSISKEWTWKLKMNENGEYHCFGVTSLLKGDGKNRIFGAPNPNTTYNDPYGWFYMDSDSDDSYYFAYKDTFKRKVYAMDIGYMDNDSLLDIVTMTHLGHKVYESKNMNQDSFVSVFDTTLAGTYYVKLIGDIDKDGYNDYVFGGKAYDQSPAEWLHDLFECDGDNHYFKKWSRWQRKDYGPSGSVGSGCGGTAGDMDGDGYDELVLCAGSILEIFKVMGNDSFELIWSMDNDTFSGSSVIMADMNGNCRKEIIWSGESDPLLPYTYGIDMMKTYIIEWRMLNSPDTIIYGNTMVPDSLTSDSFFIFNEGRDTILVDSIRFKNQEFFVDTELTYPLKIYPDDSMKIKTGFYAESTGYYQSEMYVYGDKNKYITTLKGGLGVECRIDSIKASDGFVAQSGVDGDDYVIIYFHGLTNQPKIDSSNIDKILQLNNEHSWLNIDSAYWLPRLIQKDRLRIEFRDTSSTVLVGDTVYPDSLTIQETLLKVPCFNPTVINGNFSPAGNNEKKLLIEVENNDLKIEISEQYIIWNTLTEGMLMLYDITGREVIREESKGGKHKTNVKNLKKGIYFIKLKTPSHTIVKKLLKFE